MDRVLSIMAFDGPVCYKKFTAEDRWAVSFLLVKKPYAMLLLASLKVTYYLNRSKH